MTRIRYVLTVSPLPDPTDRDGSRRLRWILKSLFRSHRFRCESVKQLPDQPKTKDPDHDRP